MNIHVVRWSIVRYTYSEQMTSFRKVFPGSSLAIPHYHSCMSVAQTASSETKWVSSNVNLHGRNKAGQD